MNKIHRRARNNYSLCGKFIKDSSKMTLNDEQVTCSQCLNKLSQIKLIDTKTSIIKKIIAIDEI